MKQQRTISCWRIVLATVILWVPVLGFGQSVDSVSFWRVAGAIGGYWSPEPYLETGGASDEIVRIFNEGAVLSGRLGYRHRTGILIEGTLDLLFLNASQNSKASWLDWVSAEQGTDFSLWEPLFDDRLLTHIPSVLSLSLGYDLRNRNWSLEPSIGIGVHNMRPGEFYARVKVIGANDRLSFRVTSDPEHTQTLLWRGGLAGNFHAGEWINFFVRGEFLSYSPRISYRTTTTNLLTEEVTKTLATHDGRVGTAIIQVGMVLNFRALDSAEMPNPEKREERLRTMSNGRGGRNVE